MSRFHRMLPAIAALAVLGVGVPAIAELAPLTSQTLASQQLAQNPSPPFPLDGRAVYVSRNGKWQEAILTGYNWNSNGGFRYRVLYRDSNATEEGVGVSRIISLAEAQKRGIAKAVYDLSTQAGISQMVAAHNEWRKRYGVPALTWSPELAKVAQDWANRLLRENRFQHRPNSKYGENLASAQGQQLSPARVVNMWGEEVKDYNYASNTCKAGAMCGHYTQVVWRRTTQVGCGMARSQNREVWVCNYNPPGNYVGQRPY